MSSPRRILETAITLWCAGPYKYSSMANTLDQRTA